MFGRLQTAAALNFKRLEASGQLSLELYLRRSTVLSKCPHQVLVVDLLAGFHGVQVLKALEKALGQVLAQLGSRLLHFDGEDGIQLAASDVSKVDPWQVLPAHVN